MSNLSTKGKESARIYVAVAAIIAIFIIAEWVSVFFFGHGPAGYP